LIAISAFELLDDIRKIVVILVSGQIALISEALAALMAYKRFLARVDVIVTIKMTLMIGGVIASIASVLLPSIHRRHAFRQVNTYRYEDLFALIE